VRCDRTAYRQRNQIERTLSRRKQFRAIATRDDKLKASFHAQLTIAAMLLWS
jgi:transposase